VKVKFTIVNAILFLLIVVR